MQTAPLLDRRAQPPTRSSAMFFTETTASSPMQAAAALLAVTVVIISCLAVLNANRRSGGGPHRHPPSPWRLPIVGNLHQLGRFPHRSLRALAAAYGPVMRINLGMVPAVVVSSADAAREVLQEQDHVFASRPAATLSVPRTLFYGCTDVAFAPYGPHWASVRKLAVSHLLGPSRVRAYRQVREQEVEALLRRVEVEVAGGGGGGVVRLSELLNDFTKDVVGRIVIGTRAAGDEGWRAKLDALVEESVLMLGSFRVGDCIPWLSWVSAVDGTDARARRAFRSIDRILDEIVDDADREMTMSSSSPGRRRGAHDAFVHVLLSLMKEPVGSVRRLDRDTVKALLEDLFGAGTESVIVVLEWAMAELLHNKGAMQKLQQEVRQRQAAAVTAVSSNDDDESSSSSPMMVVTERDLPGMEYLRAVVKETLRLHTPGPLLLPHESMRATRLARRYDVPSNTMVIVNAWAIGRDPAAWGDSPSPEEFHPERFVGRAVDFRGQHFDLIPFGSGRRMCPGLNLAMSMVELALANLVGRFDWAALPAEGDKELVDMEETPGLVVRKKAPLRAVAMQPASCPGL